MVRRADAPERRVYSPPMAAARDRPDETLGRTVREMLDRIRAAESESNDELEAMVDATAAEYRALPGPNVVQALLRAAGTSTARRRHASLLLAAREPDDEAMEVMRAWITDPSPDVRATIIQTIGAHALDAFAPLLAERIANDDDTFCRDMAVHAAGVLRAEACLPAILGLVDTDFPRWRLAEALARYASDDVRPFLERWFDDEHMSHDLRLQAAWGLGRLGDERAVAFLEEGLVSRTGTDRFRCAQAICELRGWPFEWHLARVEQTAERIRGERNARA